MGFSLFERLVVEATDRSRGNPHELGFPSWPVAETLLFRVRPPLERPPYSVVLPGQLLPEPGCSSRLLKARKANVPREAWVPSTQLALTVETR